MTIGEFAQQVSDLSASDVGRQLSVALGELADVERKAQEMQSTQSEEDCTTIMATVDEYARLINSVRVSGGFVWPTNPLMINCDSVNEGRIPVAY